MDDTCFTPSAWSFFTAIADILPLLLLIPVMVIIEWHMALMAFVLGALVFVIVLVYLKPMHNVFRKVVKLQYSVSWMADGGEKPNC